MKIKDTNALTTQELIVAIRIGLKLNQTELAIKLKTPQANVSRWEHGLVEPGLIDKQQIKNLYNTLPDKFKYVEED